MAQVTYNSIRKFRYYGEECATEGEKGREESLRDALLKRVLCKQSNTNVSIEECFKNREKFTTGIKQGDISHSAKGLLTNDTFKKVCSEFNAKEVLTLCELNDSDINLLLDGKCARRNETDEAYLQKLRNIEQKLDQRRSLLQDDTENTFSSAIQLSRREFEECSKIAGGDSAEKLTPCLVQLKPQSNSMVHPDHPINRLADLEKELFPEAEISEETKSQPPTQARKRSLDQPAEGGSSVKYFKEKPETFWDMRERPILSFPSKAKTARVYGCLNQDAKSVVKSVSIFPEEKEREKPSQDYSKPFVWTIDASNLVPVEAIHNNKMATDQIKKMAKFLQYNPGIPSSTLYLKNVPHKILPVSIVSLFGHFEEENGTKIEYRILKGRMKGQAFVKFRNVETATKAFEMCNGYILEGNPVVIEYSKRALV